MTIRSTPLNFVGRTAFVSTLLALAGTAAACGPDGGSCGGGVASPPREGPQTTVGNPIDVMSGNKYQMEVDMPALPGVLGLEIVRHYNSISSGRGSMPGSIGRGWKLSYETELRVAGNTVEVLQADGGVVTFTRDLLDATRFHQADARQGILVRTPGKGGDTFVWTWADGRKLGFDERGKLVQIQARTGEILSMQHDARGMLVRVTDPQGRSLRLTWLAQEIARKADRFRGVQHIDSPVGRFSYVYGSPMPAGANVAPVALLANLVEVRYPAAGQGRRYHYEDAAHPTLLTGVSIDSVDGAGKPRRLRYSTFGYAANGRAVSSIHTDRTVGVKLDFDRLDSTTVTDDRGRPTVYRYAREHGQNRLVEVRGAGCPTCGEPNVRYGYDWVGRVTEVTRLQPDGTPLDTTRRKLDAYGRPLELARIAYVNGKAQPAQWLERYTYETAMAVVPTTIVRPSVVPDKESTTTLAYNAAGQVTHLTETGWSPGIDGRDQPTPIARTTVYRYTVINGRSLLAGIAGPFAGARQEVPANADGVRFDYDRRGNYVTAIHAPGNVTTKIVQRDDAGRPVDVTLDDGARLLQTTSTFTPQGQLSVLAQTAWLQVPGSAQTPAQRDDASRLARRLDTEYDGAGQLAALRLPAFVRDLAPVPASDVPDVSRVSAVMEARAIPEPLLRRGAQGTSAEGDVLEIFRLAHGASDAPGRAARRWLDDFGRLAALQYDGQGVTRAGYAKQGPADRIEQLVDPMGVVTHVRYGDRGQVETLTRTSANGRVAERLEFKYAGSLLVEQARFTPNAAAGALQADSRVLTRYNAFGQVVREETISGRSALAVNHEYDDAGRIVRTWITRGSGHDALPSVRMRYQTDARLGDQIASIEAGDGWFGKHVVVNALRWLKAPSRTGGGDAGTAPVLLAWDYGNGLRAQGRFDTVRAAAGAAPWRLRAYHDGVHPYAVESNAAGHVAALTQGAARPNAAAGKAWQLLPEAEAANVPPPAAAAAAAADALAQRGDARSDQATPVAATDAAGRRLAYQGAQGRFDLIWDTAGNLAAVTRGGAEVARYRYDAQGRRIAKYVPGHPERDRLFLYSGKQLIAEADRDGTVLRQYVYVGWRPVAWIEPARTVMQKLGQALFGPTLVYLHTDPRGAVTAGTDHARTVVWEADVDRNGNVPGDGNARNGIDQPLRLVNQYADAETGMSYNLARYYDPRSGNFLSPDPAGLGSGSLDLYAYAAGDPLNYVDPDGWATIQYFAIDSGSKVGTNLQPDAGRWAFIITGIAGHLDQAFVYDRGGSYLAGGKNYDLVTQAAGAPSAATSFANFYAGKNGYYSPAAFTREMSDANAAGLIENLTGVKLGDGQCSGNLNSLLPAIPLGVQGTLTPTAAFTANPARLISCPAGTSANDILERRIQKAIEIHEVMAPGTIATDKDCSTTHYLACAANTWNPALKPGTTEVQPASYGWTQFTPLALVDALNGVSATGLSTLGITNAQRVDLAKKVAGVKKWYDKLVGNGSPNAATVAAGWAANEASFVADTGLSKVDYDRMVSFGQIGATLKTVNATYKAPPYSCTKSKCFWEKWEAADPAAKNALVQKASTELGATQTNLNPYIRNLALMGEGRAGFQWAAIVASPIGQSLLSALSDKAKSNILAKSFLDQKMKKAKQDLQLTGVANLTAAQELAIVNRTLLLQNGSADYAPKVLPHFKTIFCLEGSATSTDGYLRMDQLKVTK